MLLVDDTAADDAADEVSSRPLPPPPPPPTTPPGAAADDDDADVVCADDDGVDDDALAFREEDAPWSGNMRRFLERNTALPPVNDLTSWKQNKKKNKNPLRILNKTENNI